MIRDILVRFFVFVGATIVILDVLLFLSIFTIILLREFGVIL
jgi:hypothetical protein